MNRRFELESVDRKTWIELELRFVRHSVLAVACPLTTALPGKKLQVIDTKVLQYVRCPITKQQLQIAGEELVGAVNASIEARTLRNKIGRIVEQPISGALVNEDRSLLYLVIDDIPSIIPDEAIELVSGQLQELKN